jgi:protein-S-isoprenylcysteine O-methyltransferase Ste14
VEHSDLAAKVGFYGVIACWWAFALTFVVRKRERQTRTTRRDPISYLGLLVQAIAYSIVWFAPLRRREFVRATGSEWAGWIIAVISIALAAASVGLVIWAARCLGKQWSLGASLVESHQLIQDGPYRFVRNPIYTGMLGMLVATGLVITNWSALLVAVILFALGTWFRVRAEERLLRDAFPEKFEEYARRVPALIPGVY